MQKARTRTNESDEAKAGTVTDVAGTGTEARPEAEGTGIKAGAGTETGTNEGDGATTGSGEGDGETTAEDYGL